MDKQEYHYLVRGEDDEGTFYVCKDGSVNEISEAASILGQDFPYMTEEEADSLIDSLKDNSDLGFKYYKIKVNKDIGL